MLKKRLLPVFLPPPIRGWGSHHGYLLSIICNYGEYHSWLYSNYVQLVFDSDPYWYRLDFFTPFGHTSGEFICPLLDTQWITRRVIDNGYSSLIPFLLESVSDGYYVQLNIDTFFIPDRPSYGRAHGHHEELVVGYDTTNEQFHLLNYDDKGSFRVSTVSYAALVQAFEFDGPSDTSATGFDDMTLGQLRGIHMSNSLRDVCFNRVWLLRYRPPARSVFNTQYVVEQMEDYLESRDTSRRFDNITTYPDKILSFHPIDYVAQQQAFGMKAHRDLQDWLLTQSESEFDFRAVHILWEHKSVMRQRLRFMETQSLLDRRSGLADQYESVERNAYTFRLLGLKHAMCPKAEHVHSMIGLIDRMVSRECELLEQAVELVRPAT